MMWVSIAIMIIIGMIDYDWQVMLFVIIPLLLVAVVYFAGNYKDSQNRENIDTQNYTSSNFDYSTDDSNTYTIPPNADIIKLTGVYYVSGRDIPAGIYDIRVIDGFGNLQIPPKKKEIFMRKGDDFKNVSFSLQKELYIPVGMVLNLLKYREFSSQVQINYPKDEILMNDNIDMMDGHAFEYFCARMMDSMGYKAKVTKGSGDHGADIIAIKEGVRYAVQCKRWSTSVGNKVVEDVFYAKQVYHCHVGIIITSNYFTCAAKEAAHETGIILWDRDFIKSHSNILDSNQNQKLQS